MMRRRGEARAEGQEIVELAALADGSVAPDRRAALEARVAASPELADRLAEQQRAISLTQDAAAAVEAPVGLRARIDAQRGPRRARVSRRVAAIAAATVAGLAVLGALIISSSSPSGRAPPRRACGDRPCPRRQWRGHTDEDLLRLAGRAGRKRASAPRQRALLPGLAPQSRRRARADRDVQRGQCGRPVGRRVAEGVPDVDRHARAGRRRPGLVGREGARRNGRSRRLNPELRPSCRRSAVRPADGRGRGGSSPSPRESAGRPPPPGTTGR